MTYWAQLLHFYQPPTQSHGILKKVADESYRPLLAVLGDHENARIAVNIQGVLTELLLEHGMADVVDSFTELAERGRIEFVGSGKYHPILPLIPVERRVQSIAENNAINGAAYGAAWKPRGFFPPEMCYSEGITPQIAQAGHEWFMMSGVGCLNEWPTDRVDRVRAGDQEVAVLFRDDVRSNRISFRKTTAKEFLDDIAGVKGEPDSYVVTAMDAETFGHHIADWECEFLAASFEILAAQPKTGKPPVQLVTPSEIVDRFPRGDTVEPHASSWSTTPQDLTENNPYPLWKAPGNDFHSRQWEYVDHCLHLQDMATQHASSPDSQKFAAIAARRLEPALHSCQFWWASKRPMWDFTMIYRGFALLNEVAMNATRSIATGAAPDDVRQEARWRLAAANQLRAEIERDLIETIDR